MAEIARIRATVPTDKIYKRAMETLGAELNKIRPQIERKLVKTAKEFFLERFRNHPVVGGILGEFAGEEGGADLQAEFGLTNALAGEAIKEWEKILARDFKVDTDFAIKGKALTGFQMSLTGIPDSYKQQMVNIAAGTYTSTSKFKDEEEGILLSVNVIPWARWLMIDNSVVIEEYGITFDPGPNSRSGRATMTKTLGKAEEIPYVWPRDIIPFRGSDFIQDIYLSPSFQKQISDEIRSTATDEIRRLLKQRKIAR
jgi:hypothetical protein